MALEEEGRVGTGEVEDDGSTSLDVEGMGFSLSLSFWVLEIEDDEEEVLF